MPFTAKDSQSLSEIMHATIAIARALNRIADNMPCSTDPSGIEVSLDAIAETLKQIATEIDEEEAY